MSKGLFITLEGPEGSGKSTQAALLVERILAKGDEAVSVREPGGTPVGEQIRHMLKNGAGYKEITTETEILLFEASRAALVASVIRPALEQGRHVVCDRFADSTTAYQGYGRGYDLERLLELHDIAANGLVPDLTLLLDIEIETSLQRLEQRNHDNNTGRDRIESEDNAFHQRVREGYLLLAKKWPERFCVIDGSPPPDIVAEKIWEKVSERIDKR